MESNRAQEISERDQLWASLRGLLPEIGELAAGKLNGTERQLHVIVLLARIVSAEMDFRARDSAAE